MKKLFIVFACIAIIVSCKEEETPSIEKGEAITFGNLSTRAVDDISDIDEFGVWASVSSIGSNEKTFEALLTNERVYPTDDTKNTWTYDNTQYWVPNYGFNFFAAYPYDADDSPVNVVTNGDGSIAYTIEVTANGSDDTQDILTASNYTDTRGTYSTTVPLAFRHLLTKVSLNIQQNFEKDPDFDYYLTKVTITGLKGTGTYSFRPSTAINGGEGTWNMNNATSATIEKSFGKILLRNTESNATSKIVTIPIGGNDGLLLIPQTITANKVCVRVDYLYDIDGPDNEDYGTSRYIEGYIPATDLWQSGKAISYTMKIAEKHDISFTTPIIKPWGDPQTGGTIVIK